MRRAVLRNANPLLIEPAPPFAEPGPRRGSAGVIGRLRRKLRDIRRNSARREEDAWTRASDGWLLVSLPLAVCVTALLAWTVRSDETVKRAAGTVMRTPGGALVAVFGPTSDEIVLTSTFVDAIEVHERREAGGWPFRVWEHHHAPQVVQWDGTGWQPIKLAGFDETISAIRHGLSEGHPRLLQRITEEPVHRVHYVALAGITAMWWIALMPLGVLAILALRFGTGVATATAGTRRRARRERGLCPRCGYPTRGLEFASACPECGEMLT